MIALSAATITDHILIALWDAARRRGDVKVTIIVNRALAFPPYQNAEREKCAQLVNAGYLQ